MADPERAKRPEDLTEPPQKVKGSGFGQVAEPRPDRNRTERFAFPNGERKAARGRKVAQAGLPEPTG
jgi:hypothetical protein